MFNHRYLTKIFLIGLVLATALGLANLLYVEKSSAGISDNVSGYAWSSNIGFISFNSANAGSNTKGDYGVNIDPTTGELSGYAWSSNIGFISFNENHLIGCPSGECIAKLDLTTNELTGWAKTASSVLAGSDSGWVRLSGSNYGVDYDADSGEFSGLAWGGNLIGWIKFKSPTGLYGVTTDPNIGGQDTYPQLKILPLTTINLTSGKTEQVQVYYYASNTSSENVTNQAQWSSGNSSLVTVPSTTSGTSNTITAASGITSSQSTTISATYNGKTATRKVNVEPPVIVPTLIVSEEEISDSEIASKDIFAISKAETIDMLQNDARVVYAYVDKDGDGYAYSPQNVSGSATWAITNNTPSISISGSSSKQITSGVDLGAANIDVAYETLSYSFEVNVTDYCIASVSGNTIVPCESQLPQISFNAGSNTVQEGQSTDLNWTVTNADSCTAFNSAGSSSWNGSITNFSSSKSVTLNTATAYTLTCANSTYGTEDSKSVNISVTSPIETIIISTGTITSATITTTDGSTGTITTSGSTVTGGTLTTSGGETETISSGTITISGSTITGGTLTTSGGNIPSISFSSNYTSISSGEAVKLQWSVSNADSCSASGGWSGSKNNISGEENVVANSSTNYYLSCSNNSGSSISSIYISVSSIGGGGTSGSGSGGSGGSGGDATGNIEEVITEWLEENKTDEDTINDDYEANYQASTETISAGTTVSEKGVASYKDTCSNLGYPNFWWNAAITLYRSVAFQATNPNSLVSMSSWSWNFGEQALPKTANTNPASTKFLSATTKTITLKAFDSDGDYCKRTKTILIGGRGEE